MFWGKGGRAFLLSTPSFVLNPLRQNCLNTALSLEASRQGLAQGELNGMVSSLGYFVGAASGLIWSRIYSWGVGNGVPGIMWAIICGSQALQVSGRPVSLEWLALFLTHGWRVQMVVVKLYLKGLPEISPRAGARK